MKKSNTSGFSALEALLILAVISIIGLVGWFVYYSQNKDDIKSNSQSESTIPASDKSPEAADPYDGWKAYVTKYDKLSFKYPSNWQLTDSTSTNDTDVTPGQDWIKLTSDSSLELSIITGSTSYDGGSSKVKTISSSPVMTMGKTNYLQFTSDKDVTTGGVVTTLNDLPKASSFPLAKNIQLSQATKSNPAITDMPEPFNLISLHYANSNDAYPVKKFQQDQNYKAAIKILESVSY